MPLASLIIPRLMDALAIEYLHHLEKEIGVHVGVIRKQIERDSDLTINIINKILKRYPDVNPSFLVTGKGRPIMTAAMRKMLGLDEKKKRVRSF